jgi:chemotaxis-related protein WspD
MPEALAIDACWRQIGVWGSSECDKLKQHVHCRNCPVYSSAALQLFDRPMPVDYVEHWTKYLRRSHTSTRDKTESVFLFRLGTEWFALPTSVFIAVAENKTVHSLPHRRSNVVRGLVNIRGELIICVSLSEALGLEGAAESQPQARRLMLARMLVVEGDGGRLVFPVDEAFGVHRFSIVELQPLPLTVAKATQIHTRGVLPWEDKSVGVIKSVGLLDPQPLFNTLNRSLA